MSKAKARLHSIFRIFRKRAQKTLPPKLLSYLKEKNPNAYLIDEGDSLKVLFSEKELNYTKIKYKIHSNKYHKDGTIYFEFPEGYEGKYVNIFTHDSIILLKKNVEEKRETYYRKKSLIINDYVKTIFAKNPNFDLLVISKKGSGKKKMIENNIMKVTKIKLGEYTYYYIKILEGNSLIEKRAFFKIAKNGELVIRRRSIMRHYGVEPGRIVSVQDYGDEVVLLYDENKEETQEIKVKVKYDGYWIITVDKVANLIILVHYPLEKENEEIKKSNDNSANL
ncbi:MAG: hypothetical protein QXX23_07335 [Thermoplasmata archaeon]